MFTFKRSGPLQVYTLYRQSQVLKRCIPVAQSIPIYCYKHYSRHDYQEQKSSFHKYASILGFGSAITLWLNFPHTADLHSSENKENCVLKDYGNKISGLPEYSSEEILKHDTIENRVWISFRSGVYDVTEFVREHPGGDNIMLGAGGSVEPFWALYAVHKSRHVLEILEKYRIGNLCEDDVGVATKNMEDPFANEPRRHVALRPSSKKPFNAEPPPPLLVEKLHTPNELFYVRNHLPVPIIETENYELDIEGLGIKERTLTLEDIKKFPKHTITAAVQCGGNRRSEMAKVKYVKGLTWGLGAISNAEWSGARLYDVLVAAGVNPDTENLHVQFEGYDLDPTGSPYGASIPIEKALDPKGDVLLAYEMNGAPLPKDHGYPIRVIVPGVVGARNVKWLGKIILSEEESQSHWQQNDYKGFAPNIDWDTVDFKKSPAIQDMPVTSAICSPLEGQTVKIKKDGAFEVKGYSYSGGGRKTIRVDISTDGGKTWREVDELISDDAKHPRAWGWSIWKARVKVPDGVNKMELVVKAVDSSYNTQPENFSSIWNLRGLLSNAYHRVNIEVKRK